MDEGLSGWEDHHGRMGQNKLRRVEHPGQSECLVHFCGRGNAFQTTDGLTPQQRLDSIFHSGGFQASIALTRAWPVVCFSESTPRGVEKLLGPKRWDGWGIVVSRDWVWERGGGPIWYARDDLDPSPIGQLDPRSLAWHLKTTPQDNDWLHEREWRVPCDPNTPFLPIDVSDVVAVVVSDRAWEPTELGMEQTPDGHLAEALRTVPVTRWWWNGQTIQVLEPEPPALGFVQP